MKRIQYYAMALMVLAGSMSMASCSDKDEPDVDFSAHVYLSVAEGCPTTLTEGSETVSTIEVALSTAPKNDITLTFGVENDANGVLTVENPQVVIAAGKTTGSFDVSAKNKLGLTEAANYTFTLVSPATGTIDIQQNVTITVKPDNGAPALTAEQQALVEGWKQKYGVDITEWLGNISLTGTLEFPGDGTREPFVSPATYTLSGTTLFGLNESSDASTPVLDMLENPMGMADYLLKSFLQNTVDDREYFALEEDGFGLELMELLNWNSNSTETFGVTLPGIKVTGIANGKATLEFVEEGENYIYGLDGKPIYSEEMEGNLTYNFASSWIPFKYSYTAWSRQLELIQKGDATAMELLTYGVSAAPASYLGVYDVLTNEWEDEDSENDLYVYPKGEIDFNAGTMKFTFPFDHADQYGYSRVTVTYSIAK